MVLDPCRKLENKCLVTPKAEDKKPSPQIVSVGYVPTDNYGWGSTVNLNSIESGGTIKVGAFDDKGKAMFTDPDYKGLNKKALQNLRIQYALRHEGYDIGRSAVSEWGGDGKIGKNTNGAIFAIMKKEHLNYDQAVAWVMDRTQQKLGLKKEAHYYNTATHTFNRSSPTWATKPKTQSLAWSEPTYYQYEDQRKYGTKREYLENVWNESVLPKLKKNGHSDKYINQIRCDFLESGSKFVHATDRASTLEGAKKIGEKRAAILEKETRYAWIKDQWSNEIYPALKKNGIHKEAILAIRDEVFGELAGPIYTYTANNQGEKTIAEEAFKKATHEYVIWTPYAKNEVA